MPLTAQERSQRARAGAFAQHARYDTKQTTEDARKAWADRFVDQVDPDRELPEAERRRRAQAAMRSHMALLALKSSKARRARKATP